jgi:hypothetical protein
MQLNTIPHLVARALRDRQRITYSYINGGTGFAYGRNVSRSYILSDVRASDPNLYRFGIYLDPSRTKRTLSDYRIEPPAEPVKPVECIDLQLHALALERIRSGIETLAQYNPTLAKKIQEAIDNTQEKNNARHLPDRSYESICIQSASGLEKTQCSI